jgi:hypothetical protein
VMPQESNDSWARQQKTDAQQAQGQPAAIAANAPLQDNH